MMNVGLEEGNDSEVEDGFNVEKYEAVPAFRDLYPASDLVRALKEFGPNIVPLSLIGMLLSYAGNHLLAYVFNQFKRKIFYPAHKVTSVQLLSNGEILTTTKRTDTVVKRSANGHTVFQD